MLSSMVEDVDSHLCVAAVLVEKAGTWRLSSDDRGKQEAEWVIENRNTLLGMDKYPKQQRRVMATNDIRVATGRLIIIGENSQYIWRCAEWKRSTHERLHAQSSTILRVRLLWD